MDAIEQNGSCVSSLRQRSSGLDVPQSLDVTELRILSSQSAIGLPFTPAVLCR